MNTKIKQIVQRLKGKLIKYKIVLTITTKWALLIGKKIKVNHILTTL